MRHLFAMGPRTVIVVAFGLAIAAACDRERVEVAESGEPSAGGDAAFEAMGAAPPAFPMDAGGIDAGCAKDPLPVGVCGAECPKGFKIVDGSPTCDCCE